MSAQAPRARRNNTHAPGTGEREAWQVFKKFIQKFSKKYAEDDTYTGLQACKEFILKLFNSYATLDTHLTQTKGGPGPHGTRLKLSNNFTKLDVDLKETRDGSLQVTGRSAKNLFYNFYIDLQNYLSKAEKGGGGRPKRNLINIQKCWILM